MQTRLFLITLGVVLSLALSACDSQTPATSTPVAGSTPTTAATGPSPAPSAAALPTQEVLALLGMRAQVLAAQALLQGGQDAAALQHAQVPQGELLPALGGAGVAAALTAPLQAYVDALTKRTQNDLTATEEVLNTTYTAALDAVDQAVAGVGGAALNTTAARADLIQNLLAKTATEYDEAVRAGGPADREPYETAYGYLQVAHEQYTALQALLGAQHQTEQDAITAQLAALDKVFANVTPPPASPDPSDTVGAAVTTIGKELSAITGSALGPTAAPADLLAGSRQQVAAALASVQARQADAAYEQAAGAYLNYFEPLEGPLGAKDAALVTELEGHFKDLRDGIKAGKPVADLTAIAAKINTGLDKAQQLLVP